MHAMQKHTAWRGATLLAISDTSMFVAHAANVFFEAVPIFTASSPLLESAHVARYERLHRIAEVARCTTQAFGFELLRAKVPKSANIYSMFDHSRLQSLHCAKPRLRHRRASTTATAIFCRTSSMSNQYSIERK